MQKKKKEVHVKAITIGIRLRMLSHLFQNNTQMNEAFSFSIFFVFHIIIYLSVSRSLSLSLSVFILLSLCSNFFLLVCFVLSLVYYSLCDEVSGLFFLFFFFFFRFTLCVLLWFLLFVSVHTFFSSSISFIYLVCRVCVHAIAFFLYISFRCHVEAYISVYMLVNLCQTRWTNTQWDVLWFLFFFCFHSPWLS